MSCGSGRASGRYGKWRGSVVRGKLLDLTMFMCMTLHIASCEVAVCKPRAAGEMCRGEDCPTLDGCR